jgi:1,4-alpha-glucan branching enzyme
MEQGYLSLVLHAHLPFVRHSEHPEFLEEDWLFEAMTETYAPLVILFDKLLENGTHFRVTMSLTPPLCEMLSDALLQERYLNHINRLCELAEKEVSRTASRPEHEVALMYRDEFNRVRHTFEQKYGHNLLNAFRKFQEIGILEIIGSSATHALLPLVETGECRSAQVRIGCANYRKHFGRDPRGFWLPECAYTYGIDRVLREEGVRYFILDTHGVLYADPRPKFGAFAPILTPQGLAVFARDRESSKQVWSAIEGYPGDPMYREFFRDLGYDADYDYIHPYLHSDGVRRNIGIKYHRITGKVELGEKHLYDPAAARERAATHAGNFMFNRQQQMRHWNAAIGRKPLVVAPYDAELFGHWWFEGPAFLEYLFLKMHHDQDEIRPVTLSEYLSENQRLQVCQPAPSSWGAGGYFEVWVNNSNDWIYRHVHAAENRMVETARRHAGATGVLERALNQAARELLLAQSSDWAFIMTTGTHVAYAHKRFKDHIHRFNALYEQISQGRIDEGFLRQVESQDNLFPELSFRAYL